jgi:FtsP/CotA-like multicopper oxidase with cupredoxin domain
MSTNGHAHHHHQAHVDTGPVEHAVNVGATAAHQEARDAAAPSPGGSVVRVQLEAAEMEWAFAPHQLTRAWGFNGQVPGPVIEARVGDVLEVELTNRLPVPTSIHWHGLRLAAPMDGTDIVQEPVPPGATFVYRFHLPDAGTFWYHPHVDETTQLERGLYGAIVVRGAGEPALDGERVLVLDDVSLDRDGQLKPPGWWMEQHDGRQGSTRLVNGRQEPELTISAGQVERWRIVNAASARYVRLSIGGRPFTVLGTDGGLVDKPQLVDEVLLVPGDRVDLAVGPFAEGEVVELRSLKYDRRTIARSRDERIATIRVGAATPTDAVIPTTLRDIQPLAPSDAEPTREVHLGVRPSLKHGVKFVVNKQPHHRDRPVKVGELQVWDVVNDTLMDHPFHLHGFFFQVLQVNGKQPSFRSWEDTVNIPPRARVKIAWMPDDRPGEWMYHCHILEHHASGMMGHFEVVR